MTEPAVRTVRQQLRTTLSQGTWSAHDLAAALGIPEREVIEHLGHLIRSKDLRKRFVLEPARCPECDFVFRKRDRLERPSRCPQCKNERVLSPRFSLNG